LARILNTFPLKIASSADDIAEMLDGHGEMKTLAYTPDSKSGEMVRMRKSVPRCIIAMQQ
jgi:hypothetical protein